MDRPRPLPSVWRERSPRTKRAISSSAGMFSSYLEMFLNVIVTIPAFALLSKYTRVPGMAYLQMFENRFPSTRDSSCPSAWIFGCEGAGWNTGSSCAASSFSR